jgi:hypothetical protein
MDRGSNFQQNDINVFWGEIAPCDHVVQIYNENDILLDSLEGYVGGGIRSGDGVIVIATRPNLDALKTRLLSKGVDLNDASEQEQYIALDAEETLSRFMMNGWPDNELFMEVISNLIRQARGKGRRVRAFGEMVALLWARGDTAATVRLEYLWSALCQKEDFSLFCAYPKAGFTQDVGQSISAICATHSHVFGSVS